MNLLRVLVITNSAIASSGDTHCTCDGRVPAIRLLCFLLSLQSVEFTLEQIVPSVYPGAVNLWLSVSQGLRVQHAVIRLSS